MQSESGPSDSLSEEGDLPALANIGATRRGSEGSSSRSEGTPPSSAKRSAPPSPVVASEPSSGSSSSSDSFAQMASTLQTLRGEQPTLHDAAKAGPPRPTPAEEEGRDVGTRRGGGQALVQGGASGRDASGLRAHDVEQSSEMEEALQEGWREVKVLL